MGKFHFVTGKRLAGVKINGWIFYYVDGTLKWIRSEAGLGRGGN